MNTKSANLAADLHTISVRFWAIGSEPRDHHEVLGAPIEGTKSWWMETGLRLYGSEVLDADYHVQQIDRHGQVTATSMARLQRHPSGVVALFGIAAFTTNL
jgi:hypothetical protein